MQKLHGPYAPFHPTQVEPYNPFQIDPNHAFHTGTYQSPHAPPQHPHAPPQHPHAPPQHPHAPIPPLHPISQQPDTIPQHPYTIPQPPHGAYQPIPPISQNESQHTHPVGENAGIVRICVSGPTDFPQNQNDNYQQSYQAGDNPHIQQIDFAKHIFPHEVNNYQFNPIQQPFSPPFNNEIQNNKKPAYNDNYYYQ